VFRRKAEPASEKPIVRTFDDGYLDAHEPACPILQEFGMRAVVFGDRNIRKNLREAGRNVPVVGLVNDQQILELHQAGFEIGSHVLTHTDLAQFSKEEAQVAISRSGEVHEIKLNPLVHTFGYPYGFSIKFSSERLLVAPHAFACGGSIEERSFTGDSLEFQRIKVPETGG
jgi:peptidoglycan/xylan/chitin deacetylase (PgdA/CDA1 family)